MAEASGVERSRGLGAASARGEGERCRGPPLRAEFSSSEYASSRLWDVRFFLPPGSVAFSIALRLASLPRCGLLLARRCQRRLALLSRVLRCDSGLARSAAGALRLSL